MDEQDRRVAEQLERIVLDQDKYGVASPVGVPLYSADVRAKAAAELARMKQADRGASLDVERLQLEVRKVDDARDLAEADLQLRAEAAKTDRIRAVAELIGAAGRLEIPEVRDRVLAQIEALVEVREPMAAPLPRLLK